MPRISDLLLKLLIIVLLDCKQHSLFSSVESLKKTYCLAFLKNTPEFPLHTLYEDLLNNNYSFDKASEKLYLYSSIILKKAIHFSSQFQSFVAILSHNLF